MKTYTLEQLDIDMENAGSPEKMMDILANAVNTLDFSSTDSKEILNKYKDTIKDSIETLALEENEKCTKDIESGILSLHKCIKSCGEFQPGLRYYVKIDNISDDLKNRFGTSNDTINKYIDDMEPIIWIYYDNGIGSLKKRTVFPHKDFDKYFEII